MAMGGCTTYAPLPPQRSALPPQAQAAVAQPVSPPIPAASAHSPELLLHALSMAGFDYRRGGKSVASGFDCSGLVAHVFREAYGMKLPHNARAQSEYGKVIDASQLQAGDLVFFNTLKTPYSHVGIYLGDDRFIHAPKPGAVVRTENMKLAYWRTRFDGARRILD